MAANHHVRFEQIESFFTRCQWDDLNTIVSDIKSVVGDDDCRATLADLATHGWVKIDPPNVTATDIRGAH